MKRAVIREVMMTPFERALSCTALGISVRQLVLEHSQNVIENYTVRTRLKLYRTWNKLAVIRVIMVITFTKAYWKSHC